MARAPAALPILLALAVLALLAAPPDAVAQAGRTTGLPLPRFVSLGADEVNLRFGPGEGYPIAVDPYPRRPAGGDRRGVRHLAQGAPA